MGCLAMNCWCRTKLANLPSSSSSPYLHLPGKKYEHPYFQYVLPPKIVTGFKANTAVYASKSSPKKARKLKELQKNVNPQLVEDSPTENNGILNNSSPTYFVNNLESKDSISIASRSSVLQACTVTSGSSVLQACTVTSGFIALVGVIIRQGSHLASLQRWPIIDCSSEISFDFETWHLQLIVSLVILVSCSRFLLLKTWSDFAESSEASNQQVLTSLEPLDYAYVAFLPGISEELLFRGALLPLFGINMISASTVAVLFGILHLGSGRKFSFAIWATFVGLVYGYATILSSSLFVPMASHAINNLISGVIWRVTHDIRQQKEV